MIRVRGIKGFIGLSLIDYPGEVASVIFLGGCNLRCNYCHNKDLVERPHLIPELEYEKIFNDLYNNRNFIDGVVVTGGEPTINKDLLKLLMDLRRWGKKIKLDTNGMRPDVLEKVVNRKLIDYVAVDLKTSPDKYKFLGCPSGKEGLVVESIKFLKTQKIIDYELRTTFIPEFVNKFSFDGMKPLIDGARAYYLQGTVGTDLWKAKEFADLVRQKCLIEKFGTRNFDLKK